MPYVSPAEREVFVSRFNRVLAVLIWAAGAALAAGLLLSVHDARLLYLVPVGLFAFVAWAMLWRPRLTVGDDGLAELKERARQWQARGAPVRLLDAAETAHKVGTTAYTGSLLDERAGTVQPLAYARGLAHAAIMAGATIYTESPVVVADDDGTHWRLRTASGSVTAPWVIVATNAYTTAIWPQLRAELDEFNEWWNRRLRHLLDRAQVANPEIACDLLGVFVDGVVVSGFDAGRPWPIDRRTVVLNMIWQTLGIPVS